MTYDLPPGWSVDSADPSVGIFGDTIWHEDCPSDGQDMADYDQTGDVSYTGGQYDRLIVITYKAVCRDCGASATFTETTYDPIEPEESE